MKNHQSFEFDRLQRIWLHLRCPWRTWRETRFHLAGICRELTRH